MLLVARHTGLKRCDRCKTPVAVLNIPVGNIKEIHKAVRFKGWRRGGRKYERKSGKDRNQGQTLGEKQHADRKKY